MCGIAGILSLHSREQSEFTAILELMSQAIHHRGPDGEGIWINSAKTVGLAHVRLAIIDVTSGGAQPMRSRSGRFILTYNGEIYNYLELRDDLKKCGFSFHSHSDTEVILSAIEYWGIEEALSRLRGMFAFAVWDNDEEILWLARDRAGKKPLYWYRGGGALLFSSEIKGLLAVPEVEASPSNQALSDYLTLGFVPGPDTIYQEISEVSPGTLVRVEGRSLHSKKKTYWQFPTESPLRASSEEIQDLTEKQLIESIRLRLRSDVPVGVFLSGGIDSGLIIALASALSPRTLKSFTVSFDVADFDEAHLANQVAKKYGTEHYQISLNPKLDSLLPAVVRAYDEPFADPSAIPTFAISAEAAKHVKVVLNGEGSDELFGGYRRHLAIRNLERLLPIIRLMPKNMILKTLEALPRPRSARTGYSFFHRFGRAVFSDPYERYLQWGSDGFTQAEKDFYFAFSGQLNPTHEVLRDRWAEYNSLSPTAQFMALDFVVSMSDCLLTKIDIASMSNGIECRSPFLDHELIQWASSIDKTDLLSGFTSKPILRQIAKKYLPEAVVSAPKRGFEIPLLRWMKRDLRVMVRDMCLRERSPLLDLMSRKDIIALLDQKMPLDEERWAKRVWILFMLSLWSFYVLENRLPRSR